MEVIYLILIVWVAFILLIMLGAGIKFIFNMLRKKK
jgi:hypothetical protein